MISIIREKICVLLDKPDLSTTVKNTLEIDMKKPQLKLNHVKVKSSYIRIMFILMCSITYWNFF
jgi:energy-converting hydrogenase Eha subunit H